MADEKKNIITHQLEQSALKELQTMSWKPAGNKLITEESLGISKFELYYIVLHSLGVDTTCKLVTGTNGQFHNLIVDAESAAKHGITAHGRKQNTADCQQALQRLRKETRNAIQAMQWRISPSNETEEICSLEAYPLGQAGIYSDALKNIGIEGRFQEAIKSEKDDPRYYIVCNAAKAKELQAALGLHESAAAPLPFDPDKAFKVSDSDLKFLKSLKIKIEDNEPGRGH
jgi:hypothetical protein